MAEAFLVRVRSGEELAIAEYAARYPEFESQLKELLPAMLALEKISVERVQRLASNPDHALSDTVEEDLPDEELPRDFGRYRLESLVGRGSMGFVYLAQDTTLGRVVAVKLSRPGSSLQAKARFQREARAMATINHPNICRVFDVGVVDGQTFIAMEFIPGQTLSAYLRDNPKPSPTETVRIVAAIADAVEHAHQAGVIHRDLKPSNIILADGEPIVTDFGLARGAQLGDADLTRTGAIIGSPSYMAPEQVTAQGEKIGPTTDVYSLGVILYQMLAGKKAFEGAVYSVLQQVVTHEPESLTKVRPQIDSRLIEICQKAMSKNREDRFQSAGELAETLSIQGAAFPDVAHKRPVARVWGVAAAIAVVMLGVLIPLWPRFSGEQELSNLESVDRKQSREQTSLVPPRARPSRASSGEFSEFTRFGKQSFASVSSCDIDDDGDIDVCVVPTGKPMVELWLNHGDGRFHLSSQRFELADAAKFTAFGDVDADGDYDLFIATEGEDSIWENDGRGSFSLSQAGLKYGNSGRPSFADFDADGSLDVYVPVQDPELPDVILFNDGAGSFLDLGVQLPAARTRQVAVGDFDGNGYVDVYRANIRQPDDAWWNVGQRHFEECEQSFEISFHSYATESVDVDQDSDLDIVVADNHLFERSDTEIAQPGSRIWINQGDRSFVTKKLHEFEEYVAAIQHADLNGDQHMDLWAAREQTMWTGSRPRQSAVFLGGVNSQGMVKFYGHSSVVDGSLVDVDLDGDIDCVAVGQAGAIVWKNGEEALQNSKPIFVESAQRLGNPKIASNNVLLEDFDSDGDLDAFVSNFDLVNQLWLNDGSGTFSLSPQSFTIMGEAGRVASAANMVVAAADLDKDGDLELLTTGLSIPISLWKNNGNGQFEHVLVADRPVAYRHSTVFCDVDGDGDKDIVIACVGHPNEIWRNEGNLQFALDAGSPLGEGNYATVVVSDLNADGRPDILLGALIGNRGIDHYANTGNGFQRQAHLDVVSWGGHRPSEQGVPVWASGIAIADFSGDGFLDFVSSCGPYPSSLWINDGRGGFLDQRCTLNHFGSEHVVAADFDQDGLIDLVFGNGTTEPLEFVRGLGDSKFAAPRLFHKRYSSLYLAVGDLDSDGDLDIFSANIGANTVWFNQTIP